MCPCFSAECYPNKEKVEAKVGKTIEEKGWRNDIVPRDVTK